MAHSKQVQGQIFSIGLRATIAVLAFLYVLTVVATPAAQAQTYTVIHNFTGGQDGAFPETGLTMDACGKSPRNN